MYMVISKPKRKSMAFGVSHCMVILLMRLGSGLGAGMAPAPDKECAGQRPTASGNSGDRPHENLYLSLVGGAQR